MKYFIFLIAILVVTNLFLPQTVAAQKRSVKSAKTAKLTKKGKVKKTAIVKKARVNRAPVKPVTGLIDALVVPRCIEPDNYLSVLIYGYPVTIQYMIFKDQKLWVRKADGTLSSERIDFVNATDYDFAAKLVNEFEPTEMEIFPAVRYSPSFLTTVVLKKTGKKWGIDDGNKVYEIVQVQLEPKVKVRPAFGECDPASIAEQTQP